ncbi:MAG: AmmeMemoRadiSam system protein B [Rubrivivax sp.]|nr:AmmeMemoRadiSam system protein B [Rubrivivax sp.]MDH5339454.1 AmmeMemoRadiSam system protein B [Rubrivivax sp.]
MLSTRPAVVAGTFYPADVPALQAQVQACLGAGAAPANAVPCKMLIVPHAGYVYSGVVAGHAYARLAAWAPGIRRVVLLGPAHRVALRGLAAPTVDVFDTPLGRVRIDREALDGLADLPQVARNDRAHALEHSLEVQLPFLQTVLGRSFTLVPLAVGEASADDVAAVLERLWGGDETLIVISSDLSHYLPYATAAATDRTTAARIVALATDLDPYEACGAHALNGALLAARRHGLRAELLDLRNSGDTAGDRRQVVGYAALALTAPLETALDPGTVASERTDAGAAHAALGAALLSRARNTIATALGLAAEPEPPHADLSRPGATFVTLHDAQGELRGCIGRLEPVAPLEDDVRRNAAAAAFDDPRFAPLRSHEWAGLRIEVSLLDAPEPMAPARTRAQALSQLQPHADGVILAWRGRRATFLPQVWGQLPQPEAFMAALLRKAGLAPDFWAEDLQLWRYGVRHFSADAAAPAS